MNNIKSIKLTRKHQEKLYKMCFAFLPEYGILFDGLICKKCDEHRGEEVFMWFYHNNQKKDFYIHWFEFCIKYLKVYLSKLAISKGKNIIAKEIDSEIENHHPVDYLYKQFIIIKRINNNEKTNKTKKKINFK